MLMLILSVLFFGLFYIFIAQRVINHTILKSKVIHSFLLSFFLIIRIRIGYVLFFAVVCSIRWFHFEQHEEDYFCCGLPSSLSVCCFNEKWKLFLQRILCLCVFLCVVQVKCCIKIQKEKLFYTLPLWKEIVSICNISRKEFFPVLCLSIPLKRKLRADVSNKRVSSALK